MVAPPDERMPPRAALVTGGSSGIGLEIARALGQEGYRLTIAARRPKRLQAAVESLRAAGASVQGVAMDVAKEEDVAALIRAHREAHGRLDVLVNSAGAGVAQPIEALRSRVLDKLVAVNLRGIVLCTREALPQLREAGAEHGKALIVNVASVSGKSGRPGLAAYAATKAGAIAFTRSTRREVGSDGVQCTAIAPGAVDTPMMAAYGRAQPTTAKMIPPSDIGETVRFLLRLSANSHIPEIVLMLPGDPPAAA